MTDESETTDEAREDLHQEALRLATRVSPTALKDDTWQPLARLAPRGNRQDTDSRRLTSEQDARTRGARRA